MKGRGITRGVAPTASVILLRKSPPLKRRLGGGFDFGNLILVVSQWMPFPTALPLNQGARVNILGPPKVAERFSFWFSFKVSPAKGCPQETPRNYSGIFKRDFSPLD